MTKAFDGNFIDPDDRPAMEDWARRLCQGLDVPAAAKQLHIEPTVHGVAVSLLGNSSEDEEFQQALITIC